MGHKKATFTFPAHMLRMSFIRHGNKFACIISEFLNLNCAICLHGNGFLTASIVNVSHGLYMSFALIDSNWFFVIQMLVFGQE
jgi:hypothetical protein